MYPDYFEMYNPYYGMGEREFRNNNMQQTVTYTDEIITLNQAINLIRQSIGNEKEDEMFYDTLISEAPSEKEKNIIRGIRNDERKHNQILRNLYYQFTGRMPQENMQTTENTNNSSTNSYKENLEKALFGELDAVVKYRKILAQMPSGDSYTLIMSIMTDELRHANKYNFLIHMAG